MDKATHKLDNPHPMLALDSVISQQQKQVLHPTEPSLQPLRVQRCKESFMCIVDRDVPLGQGVTSRGNGSLRVARDSKRFIEKGSLVGESIVLNQIERRLGCHAKDHSFLL